MPVVSALLGTIGSAAAYGLCFPPAELRGLAWVVLVPFLVAVRRAGPVGAGLLAWLWTVVAAYAVGDWFPWSVSTYYQQPIAVGIAFFAGVSSVMAAPYFIVFAACYRAMASTPAAVRPLLVAAAWVGADWSRANLVSGNPWALFGYSQSGVGPLIQIADVTGAANCHLHFDHSGQNVRLPGVPIFVQRTEWAMVHEPNYTIPEWIDAPGLSYELLDEQTEVAPGLRLVPTPGHSAGHQSLVLQTPDGPVVLAGQALQSRAEWEGATDPASSGEPNAPDHTYLGMMIRNMDLMLPALGGDASAVTALSPADTYAE